MFRVLFEKKIISMKKAMICWKKYILIAALTALRASGFSPSFLRERQALALLFSTSPKVGIFYGTSTGSTSEAANLIYRTLGEDIAAEPQDIDALKGEIASTFSRFDSLIAGTPTWNTGADTERSGTGWDEIYYGELSQINLQGKKAAVFGLGDSVSYGENYADAAGELHDVLEGSGCRMMGYTSQEGYLHEASKAIRQDLFCGLLLDVVNQEDLTEGRVKAWVAQLIQEGFLEGRGDVVAPVAVPQVVMQADVLNHLEDNSSLLQETLKHQKAPRGYTSYFNPLTKRTMHVSSDGRSCYYTSS